MTDSYRPGTRIDSYRPTRGHHDAPPVPTPDAREAMFYFRGSQEDGTSRDGLKRSGSRRTPPRNLRGGRRRRDQYSGRGGANRISDRPLLRTKQTTVENRVFADPNAQAKFRRLDELTDSEEEVMAQSEDTGDDEERMPPANAAAAVENENRKKTTAKWSDPNPYTSLPPPSEATGKRRDFVKLIRKARVAATRQQGLVAQDQDFISFDMSLDESSSQPSPPPSAPTGPRATMDRTTVLGKRKRSDEEASSSQRIRRNKKYFYEDGMVLNEWRCPSGVNTTPWFCGADPADLPAVALHKEIVDFYDWVKPRDFEAEVRADVVRRLSLAFNRIEPGELKAFGSYSAGLYLPTGDMDLVFLQRSYKPGRLGKSGLPRPPERWLLRRFADQLRFQEIAQPGSVQLIAGAKVPIIKFVDRVSGLKVDLSFNNETGIVANETFQKWKKAYPAMPIIVSVVKQYLMIRGLNDVSIGGLGGFSIICLVTSLIQHLPPQGRLPNLGQLLLEFFNLYGNLLDRESVAIRLDPPAYLDKRSYMPHVFNNEKADRLAIIDPNRPENNISGGSSEIGRIFRCFSHAHEVLQTRLAAHADLEPSDTAGSFLQDLVGGDFSAYDAQRAVLRDLYFGTTGKEIPAIPPPPPPPPLAPPPPPPPPITKGSDPALPSREPGPPEESNGSGVAKPGPKSASSQNGSVDSAAPDSPSGAAKKPSKDERRAKKLKTRRPDLGPMDKRMMSVDETQ